MRRFYQYPKNPPTKQNSKLLFTGFTNDFDQKRKEKFIPILPKPFPIYGRGEKTHLFYDVSFSLIPKPDKDPTSKLQANIPDERREKILNKILAN